MNKLQKLFCLFVILLYNLQILSNSAINHLYKNNWEFLEDKFVNSNKTNIKTKVGQIGISGFTGFITYLASNKYLQNYNTKNMDEYSDESINIINTSSAGTSSLFMYILLQYIYKYKNSKQNFLNFIKEWPENKKFTPKELHQALEIAYKNYKNNPEQFHEEAHKILELLNKRIQEQFPEKNKKNIIKKYFVPKVLTNSLNLCFGTFARWTTHILWCL